MQGQGHVLSLRAYYAKLQSTQVTSNVHFASFSLCLLLFWEGKRACVSPKELKAAGPITSPLSVCTSHTH